MQQWKCLLLWGELDWAVQLFGFSAGLCLLGFDFPVISWSIRGDVRAGCCVSRASPVSVSSVGSPCYGRGSCVEETRSVADVVFYEEGRYMSLRAWAVCCAPLI